MENKLGDVKILGSGESSGGEYNQVKILGSGDINGDLKCKELKVMGSGDINGNVDGENIKVAGAADIDGNVKGDYISVSGAADIKGDINCKELKIAGAIDVDGNVYSEEIKVSGAVEIGGNCEAEIFNSNGVFEIDGMLNAGEINIKLKGKNEVGEVGGEKIDVRKNDEIGFGRFFKMSFNNSITKLQCELIEGDEIYLEYTHAETVRGKNIVLGPGCNIENVEYSGSFNMSNESKVGVTKQI
ncbi:polymer-forming cytoskeletal protein [Clostridium sp. KNHs214]|uniref:polymer-forming cytoskeletal protein n=1 Tax=Clostridium sp. KNHs214 TaxID=1540257 RepID=UPI0005562EF7|nr:polymer-forming cytoskeletal protein [Clostridium sp. KNHs214]